MARSRRGRGGRGYGYGRREEPELRPVRVDLHVHTPFSADFRDLDATYLQILQAAAARRIDMIAITDHNTVGGVAAMRREIEDLTLLEELDRLTPEEAQILAEYRRLLDAVVVLPGFEFTAAYGFHILGIFPPETSVRRLEHLLMTLGLTEAQIDAGSSQVSGTADVLTTYEIIDEFGGMVIPAHANAAHGVAMQGARYGEQTRIAYTQSPLIAALDVTDLDDTSRRGSAASFNGTRTDYPRQMHLIQTSDAHRVTREDARHDIDFGVGERSMELLLPERSFTAVRQLLASDDFTREHPYYPVPERAESPLLAARAQGPTITQAFHEQARSRRSRYRPVLKDVVAFANTNGGTIYIGMSSSPNVPVVGVPLVDEVLRGLRDAIARSIVPRLDVTAETETTQGKSIIVVHVPKGPNTPYATEAGQVFVRQDAETVIALRDEIVQLVQESARDGNAPFRAGTGERHWTAPRPVLEPDEEDGDGDGGAEPVATRMPSAPTPTAVRPSPPPMVSSPPVSTPQAMPPFTAAAPPEPPRETHPAPIAEPSPAPVVAPTETTLPQETPASDVFVGTVPGVAQSEAEPPETASAEAAPPKQEIEPPLDAAPQATDAPEAAEVPEAAPRDRRRAPRRRSTNRSRAVRDAESNPLASPAVEAEAEQTLPALSPVYSLEPPIEAQPSSPPASVAPSMADTGIVAEATGEEAEPVAAAPAPPRRRRRAPSRAKAAASTDGANPLDVAALLPTTETAASSDAAASPARETAQTPSVLTEAAEIAPPTAGIEILAVDEQENGRQYTLSDLKTGKITHNVTRKTARGPMRQAILAREDRLPNEEHIVWHGARGFGRAVVRDGVPQYDLVLRAPDGHLRIFYAVPTEGLDDAWRAVVPQS